MKYDCFKNKVAFITGSTSGFGRATAIELAKNSAIVILNYANDADYINGENVNGGILLK